MMCLSAIMIANPNYWAEGIITFSKKSYFHWFEVFSRLIAGVVFVIYSHTTRFPNLINVAGYLLIAVGVGLIITGATKHKQFAVWSAHKFKHTFRPAGVFSFIFGGFLIYISVVIG